MNERSQPTLREMATTWARIGILSFGGPAAQIALMHKIIVDEKKWLTEQQYLNALSFCMLLPGPEATQLAAYSGWRVHGVVGGLMAGLLFVVPGALIVLALTVLYGSFGSVPLVEALFFGVKAAVLVIVIEALLRVASRTLTVRSLWVTAVLSFIAIFFLNIPFPFIIVAAALIGYSVSRLQKPLIVGDAALERPVQPWTSTAGTIALWLSIWLGPLLLLAMLLGQQHVLVQLGLFFSKLAVVSFGGAYAVLSYMAQDVVASRGWLDAGQMLDGLGLAETTPGPLILVTEFVGFLAAYQHGGNSQLLMGLLGALVALWATFVPCFLWIFAGAPYVEWMLSKHGLRSALRYITAAVVGVILNLTLWFALHVLFMEVKKVEAGWLTLWTPTLDTFDLRAALLSAVGGLLLLRWRWNIAAVLAAAATLGIVLKLSGV